MRPANLLFIFTDEQRADTMAAYGNDQIETPVLNRLANQSTVFDNCYVTQPVCTPSRSSIMTGLWPHTNGCVENNIPLRPETPCLPEMLNGGYATGYYGKWHLGDEIFAQHGFDEWVSIEDGYHNWYSPGRDQAARSDYHHWLLEKGFSPDGNNRFPRHVATQLPEEFGKPAFLAGRACDFIRRNKDNPFVLYVNFLEPHMPFFGPRDDQYDPAEVMLPANFDCPPTGNQPLKARILQRLLYEKGHDKFTLRTEADWRRLIANYWGLCSLVDTHVGTILAALEDCGLDENTIVVYTSDHGDMMGSHRLLAKTVMFEESLRVPLLVRLPAQRRSRHISEPIGQIDLVPTLLDLMQQDVPSHLEGSSRRSALEGGPPEGDDVFVEWTGPERPRAEFREPPDFLMGLTTSEEAIAAWSAPIRSVVTADGWKFNLSGCGEHELYNLRHDPIEVRNLAGEAENLPLINKLTDRIHRWQERTSDSARLEL